MEGRSAPRVVPAVARIDPGVVTELAEDAGLQVVHQRAEADQVLLGGDAGPANEGRREARAGVRLRAG